MSNIAQSWYDRRRPPDRPVRPPSGADRAGLADPATWRAAEAQSAVSLARAAMALGRLDGMLAAIPGSEARRGAITRLAMIEVEAMGWAAGHPIAADELGRDLMDARAGTDLAALHRARWAIARLQGRGRPDDLRGFLGFTGPTSRIRARR